MQRLVLIDQAARVRATRSNPRGLLEAVGRDDGLSSFDVRLVALHEPTPAYPHSLIWHRDHTHQALALLRTHAGANACLAGTDETRTPA